MRIIVKNDDKNYNLIFPTALICSRFGIRLISKHCKTDKWGLTSAQLKAMANTLNRFRKKHRGWVLLEAESDGDKVVIKL